MSDSREWRFNSPDVLKIPFIFVPDGDSIPADWLASHPDAFRIRARFVPSGNSGRGGGGALQADVNEAMIQWLGRAAGDDGAPVAQPEEGGWQIAPPAARLADVLAASDAGTGSLSENNLGSAERRFLYPTDDDAAVPHSQPGLEAQFAANAPGAGEGRPTGTTLHPSLMKFILGTSADPAGPRPKVNRELGETVPGPWLADWRPSPNNPPLEFNNPTTSHIGSALPNAQATTSDPGPRPLTQAEMLKLARMRALLRLIRSDENQGASDDKAYHARYGNRDPMSDADMTNDKPKTEKLRRKDGVVTPYTAAGAYQILERSWNRASKILGIKDFTPADQDRIASFRIEEAHATSDMEEVKLPQAIRKLKGTWRALPGGSQSHATIEADTAKFNRFVDMELKRIEHDLANGRP